MSVTDPISDMLNRIRNAHGAGMDDVEMPHSRLMGEIARILKREGFISEYVVENAGGMKRLKLYLKYFGDRQPVIRGLRRISKPGLHQYVGVKKIPRVRNGMGIAILSTSAGMLTDREARKRGVGGEVLCCVW